MLAAIGGIYRSRVVRSKLEAVVFDEAHATTAIQDTLVAVWRGDPTAARLTLFGAELRAIAQRNRGRVFCFNVITAATPVPTHQSLAELRKQFHALRGQLLALAIILEKDGLEGTLSRAVLSTTVTVTRQPFPLRVFAQRKDGAGWLSAQTCSIPPDRVLYAASALEQQLIDPGASRGSLRAGGEQS